jgi:hypothetical protein
MRHHALLMSPTWFSPPYLVLLHHILARADEFATKYNAALAAYRREERITTPGRPMPDLHTDPDRVEAAFWLDDLTRQSRRRLFLKRTADAWQLEGEDFAFDPAAEAFAAAQRLAAHLRSRGLRITPRAQTLTTFFRLFTVIPIAIVLAAVSGGTYTWDWGGPNNASTTIAVAGGFLFLAPLLMILFRKKYPRWWFDWNRELARFTARVHVYFALLTDQYPSTDEQQSVHLEIVYPDAESDLARGMPLVKWLLAIPHYIVLFFLGIAAFVSVIIAWFAILFTGTYPRSLFDFIVGVYRWGLRVAAYAFLLITDRYPPFSLE